MFWAEPWLLRFQASTNFLLNSFLPCPLTSFPPAPPQKKKKENQSFQDCNHFKNEFSTCVNATFTALGTEAW